MVERAYQRRWGFPYPSPRVPRPLLCVRRYSVRAYRLILGVPTAMAVFAVMLCGVGSAAAAIQVRAASSAIHAQSPAGVRSDARHEKRHHKAKKLAKPRPLATSTIPGPGNSPAIPPSSPGTPQPDAVPSLLSPPCLVTTPPQLPPTGPGPTALVGGIYSFGGPACDGGSTPALLETTIDLIFDGTLLGSTTTGTRWLSCRSGPAS